jgi:thiamine pyrophosphokinase
MILVVADGEALAASELKRLARSCYTIALDGAAEAFRKQGRPPNLVLGDFDTVRPQTLLWCQERGSLILHQPNQNYTDLEKALQWCRKQDAEAVTIVQALGGDRLDHSLANLSALKRFHTKGKLLQLLDRKMKARFVRNESLQLLGRKGRTLGLIPFPECSVRSIGLAFEMQGERLRLGGPLSVSNRVLGNKARLKIDGSALLVEER